MLAPLDFGIVWGISFIFLAIFSIIEERESPVYINLVYSLIASFVIASMASIVVVSSLQNFIEI
jgi:hypothetical protein